MTEILINLGEYGQILVDAPETVPLTEDDTGMEKVSLINDARQSVQKAKQILTTPIEVDQLLKLPLTGLAKLLLASLPEPSEDDTYDLDTFSVEFNLGIKTETGTNVGAIAKIMPEGAFKCSYTWKRKPNLETAKDE